MAGLKQREIINFLKENILPLKDGFYGEGYRASVLLRDNTFLPCVIFRHCGPISKRTGNYINYSDIASINESPGAFPLNIQMQITSETAMGYTMFVARFKDGRLFNFGTNLNFDFFELSDGYSKEDITEIINHSYVTKAGEVIGHRSARSNELYCEIDHTYRDRPFFECHLDGL